MKIKLDENIGDRGASLFREANHDVATVVEEGLCTESDRVLIERCKIESRCLVTLDLDFANPLIFNPIMFAGIAVLRLPAKPSFEDLLENLKTLIAGLADSDITGKLWIVQGVRIREYQSEE